MAAKLGNPVVSSAMQEELVRLGSAISEKKGTVLFRRGDAVHGLYLVRSGRVSLSLSEEAPALPTRIAGAGSVVGLPGTVAGTAYSLMAEVIEDAELVFVARAEVIECLQRNQALCFEVMDLLSAEISGARAALKQGTGGGRLQRT
ncbi:MAG: Crp/Fnr family transcriptional regulator [Terriglobales bacterium]|jgi:CRP-like cAMP-binding protein